MKTDGVESRRGLLNPAKERLWSKLISLEETLFLLEKTRHSGLQEEILKRCRKDLESSRACFDNSWWMSYHPHLAWELMHRVDENLLLLVPEEELPGSAVDIMTSFDLNMKEERVREKWLGREGEAGGILRDAVNNIRTGVETEKSRQILREALRMVNTQADRQFWTLSMNTMMSVLSGLLLGAAMLILWYSRHALCLSSLGTAVPVVSLPSLAILGLMGAYLSNLMTRDDFLFVRGGPFWRYAAYHLAVKPILGAFAAIFIFILEKSKLIFSITAVQAGEAEAKARAAGELISLNVSADAVGYVYVILAVVTGFAADKVLREMFDRVLRRLEEKAEKTKETRAGG